MGGGRDGPGAHMSRGTGEHLYTTLGVPRTATQEQIRAAYYELVARYHPDKYSGHPLQELASEKMALINHAYEVLSDPVRRQQYDEGLTPDPVEPYAARDGTPAAARRSWPGLLLLAVAVIALILFLSGFLIWFAPDILTEAAFGALLSGGLAKRAKQHDAGGWVGGVVRKTWWLFAIVLAASTALGGWASSHYPEARTLHQAVNMALGS